MPQMQPNEQIGSPMTPRTAKLHTRGSLSWCVPAKSRMTFGFVRCRAGRGRTGSFMGMRRVTALRPSPAEPAKNLHTKSSLWEQARGEDPVYRGNMYISGAKAKNPMKKVGIAWAIGFPSGILLFFLAKRKVDKRRLEQMKARQRMRDANKGEYNSERFHKSV